MDNENKRAIRLFVLGVLIIVLLVLMGSSGLAAGDYQIGDTYDISFVDKPEGGGGAIGSYPVYGGFLPNQIPVSITADAKLGHALMNPIALLA